MRPNSHSPIHTSRITSTTNWLRLSRKLQASKRSREKTWLNFAGISSGLAIKAYRSNLRWTTPYRNIAWLRVIQSCMSTATVYLSCGNWPLLNSLTKLSSSCKSSIRKRTIKVATPHFSWNISLNINTPRSWQKFYLSSSTIQHMLRP